MKKKMEEEDRISQMPDEIKVVILSKLPTKDCVRTSVLSQMWKNTWRFTSCICLDQKSLMPRDEMQRYLESTTFVQRLDLSVKRAKGENVGQEWDPIGAAARQIRSVINGYRSTLKSFRIQHMLESKWEAEEWVKKVLVEKSTKELYMERDIPESSNWSNQDLVSALRCSNLKIPFEVLAGYEVIELSKYILHTSDPPNFEYPQNLKSIKLTRVTINTDIGTFFSGCLSLENITLEKCHIRTKVQIHNPNVKVLNLRQVMHLSNLEVFATNLEVMVLNATECVPQAMVIVAPNLKVFHCYCPKFIVESPELGFEAHVEGQILEGLCGTMTIEGTEYPSPFENLVSLYTNLNLRSEKDTMLLSLVLKSCHSLENLDIKNEANDGIDVSRDHETNVSVLPCPARNFWGMMEYCECVSEKLKTVNINGFKGKELEVEFVKFLITVPTKMEKITISFDNDCKWEEATATVCLLSFPRNSPNLTIILEPGKDCLESGGMSFQKWVLTLK